MERARLAGLVALAFFAAAIAGALVFSEGGSPFGVANGRADALLVEVENDGHDARVLVQITRAGGSGSAGTWEWTIPSGLSQTARVPNPSGDQIVRVVANWSDAPEDHRGEARFVVDPDGCGGKDALFRVRVDTSRGVAITSAGALTCR